jgi:hypothetical protein
MQSTPSHRLHVVIANAAQDVSHADDVARLIIDRRAVLGDRLAVVFGGDSRDITQQAVNRLLDHDIPVISPNLNGDLGQPGRPFVDRPGYLQLSAPNQVYAQDLLTTLHQHYRRGFRLAVFQVPAPADVYTTSLVNDLLAAADPAPRAGPPVAVRHVTRLDALDSSICTSDTSSIPTIVFFADRWTSFGPFAQRVTDVCGYSGPRRVIADSSVTRFMAGNALRVTTSANWPLDYYAVGDQCPNVNAGAMLGMVGRVIPSGKSFSCSPRPTSAVYCTLDAAESTSHPCLPNDLGPYVEPTWDAVQLADHLPLTNAMSLAGLHARTSP